MFGCCSLNPSQLKDQLKTPESKSLNKAFNNARMASISLVVVSVAFILLGAMLIQHSMSTAAISQGYGFVFHFVGTHALGFGLLLTLATVASSALTLYRRLQIK